MNTKNTRYMCKLFFIMCYRRLQSRWFINTSWKEHQLKARTNSKRAPTLNTKTSLHISTPTEKRNPTLKYKTQLVDKKIVYQKICDLSILQHAYVRNLYILQHMYVCDLLYCLPTYTFRKLGNPFFYNSEKFPSFVTSTSNMSLYQPVTATNLCHTYIIIHIPQPSTSSSRVWVIRTISQPYHTWECCLLKQPVNICHNHIT